MVVILCVDNIFKIVKKLMSLNYNFKHQHYSNIHTHKIATFAYKVIRYNFKFLEKKKITNISHRNVFN